MAKQQPKLAYTVHHKGRKYQAGLTAEDVGAAAGEFGDHVWAGGNAPTKTQLSDTTGGTLLGSPPVPGQSGLPLSTDTPAVPTVRDTGDSDGDSTATRRATGGGRRAGSGS